MVAKLNLFAAYMGDELGLAPGNTLDDCRAIARAESAYFWNKWHPNQPMPAIEDIAIALHATVFGDGVQ